MRSAINENRTVQLTLLAVLALMGGFLLLKSRGSSGSEASTSQPAATSPAPIDTGAATATTAAPTTDVSAVSGAAIPASLVPGPGLPQGLLNAYRDGDAVALLVRRAGGIDDSLVRGSVELLRGLSGVAVYVTKAKHIARYAWLTQGVNVTDLPALVVLLPRELTNGTPEATVSYGFRDSASVLQAVEDALYRGPTNRPYHP